MKAIHCADIHIGFGSNSPIDSTTQLPGRVLDVLDMLDSMIDFAEDDGTDVVLIAGDVYDKPSPTPTLVRALATRIARLSKICPVLIIPGNHDLPGTMGLSSSVDIFAALQVPNVIVFRDPGVRRVATNSGDLQVAAFPYPIKRQLLTPFELSSSRHNELFKERIGFILDRMAMDIDDSYPSVFMGHFGVDTAAYGSEQRLATLGQTAEVGINALTQAPWGYVALGHIHKRQQLNRWPPIFYSGSLERCDFSEEHESKGFISVDLEDPAGSVTMIDVDARPYRTIRVDASKTKHPTKVLIRAIKDADLEGAVVRVIVEVGSGGSKAVRHDDIYKELDKAGAYMVTSFQLNEPKPQLRSLDTDKPIASMTPMELLKVYFESQNTPPKRARNLLRLAADIIDEVDNG